MSNPSEVSPKLLANVKHVLLVLSGKGGVGKSSVTTQVALSLSLKGYDVGVLDIDLTGPSLPRMFGVESSRVHQSQNGWVPVQVHKNQEGLSRGNLLLMSLGLLMSKRDSSIVWRGPKKTAMIRQFMSEVAWYDANNGKDLDYLIIDTPPGTSDEHIAIAEELRWATVVDGAIIVTTPQQVATADVRKEINFCKKVNFNILGIIENMSGFICPHCSDCTDIFSKGGGRELSESLDLKFLGEIPIDPSFIELIETQTLNPEEVLAVKYLQSKLYPIVSGIVDNLVA